MIAYHVVTERPMYEGQVILFDEDHRSGVYRRVMDKMSAVEEIYAHPDSYDPEKLEHHTSVALRELALEQVRKERYPHYPSRMGCLYVSRTLAEAENWAKFFADLGRPTYHIVKLEIQGNLFQGDATRCFRGQVRREENLRLAENYWSHTADPNDPNTICELLANGTITVVEIVKEINANL